MNFNLELFKAINGLAHKNVILDSIMIVFSKYVPIAFMAALAAVYVAGIISKNEKMRCIAVDTFAVTAINLLLSFVIGLVYYVPRPFVNRKVNLLFPHVIDASFPSDHAMGTMSIAAGINKYSKLYGRVLIALSCIVGVSRVYVGHHYPIDVIGGYAIVLIVNSLYKLVIKDSARKVYISIEEILLKYLLSAK